VSLALIGGQGARRRLRQPFLDRRDRCPQPHDVAVLGVTGEAVLIVVGADDGVGPSRTRLGGQSRLAGIEPIPAGLPPGLGV
jgi:hypothetical protein